MAEKLSINKAVIPNVERKDIFKVWLEFTVPMHHLSPTDIKALSEMLNLRDELSLKITDNDMLNEYLFGQSGRKILMKRLDVDNTRLNNIIHFLRKKKVIIDQSINPSYIPNLQKEANSYYMTFEFKIKK